ncbi:hypothetical protein ACWGNE_08080 [Streptomyces xiamenensis]
MSATSGSPAGHAAYPGRFPSGAKYVEALQNPTLCFRESELRACSVERDPVLGPKPISGNFSSVFSVTTTSGRRYALKCFTQNVAAQGFRYDAISAHLAGLGSASNAPPWVMSFQYQPDGIMVEGTWFPLLKMEWVKGRTLIRWIDDHYAMPGRTASLAEDFASLVADLAAARIAHGDLQHGNLLVADDGTFRLVDYDGMFVPALGAQRATEKGHRNYQSPQRADSDFGPHLDRFSAWIIYFSLIAVSVDPALWSRLHDPNGEFLLLTEEDFRSPATSFRFRVLLDHPDHRLRALATQVGELSSQPLSRLPALNPQAFAKPSPAPGTGTTAPQGGGSTSTPPGPGQMPSWLTDHHRQSGLSAPSPPPGAPQTPLLSATAVRFLRRRVTDVVAAVASVILLVSLVMVTASSGPVVSVLLLAVTLLLPTLMTWRGRTEVRAARRHRAGLQEEIVTHQEPEKVLVKLEEESKKFEENESTRAARSGKEIQKLQAKQHKAAERINQELRKNVAAIDHDLSQLSQQVQKRQNATLAARQKSHIQERLRQVPIQDAANLSNLGAKTIQSFMASGIRTAADFTGVRYVAGTQYGTLNAHFILANGGEVRVFNVGQKRGQEVERWRDGIEARARESAPQTLSKADLRFIADRITADRARLRHAREKAERDARLQHDRLRRSSAGEQRLLLNAQNTARLEASRRRAEFQQQHALFTGRLRDLAQLRSALADARRAHRTLGYPHYLKFLLTGR